MRDVESVRVPSNWLRIPLVGLAGIVALVVATAALQLFGLGTSNGLWPGLIGGITILGAWYLTSNARMVRPVALGLVGAVALCAAAVAIQISA